MKNRKLLLISKQILLFLISLIFSLIVASITTNYYLKIMKQGKESENTDWTLYATKYNLRSINWLFSFCETNGECREKEEKYSPFKVNVFNRNNEKKDCKIILFLGDSFTDAPWTSDDKKYSYIFSKRYSDINDECVKQVLVSTGGTGTSQKFVKFLKVVRHIKPDFVVWQFCENYIYENVRTSVHAIKNDRLIFKSAITNTQFWVGFLNQNIPFLLESTLGKHLMYIGEKRDVFRSWPADFYINDSVIDYNKKFLNLVLDEMIKKSKKEKFELYTTISPLECNFIQNEECSPSITSHLFVENILKEKTNFISMENIKNGNEQTINFSPDNTFYENLFNTTEDKNPIGHRHLSETGNQFFGEILFQNYLNLNKTEN